MADNVENAIFEILKKIQADVAKLNERAERSEALARKDRRNINGLMTIIQSVAGDFDERIREVDDRVSILEDRAS